MQIVELAKEVNARSEDHPIGRLQQIRSDLKGLDRPSSLEIFGRLPNFEDRDYIFHTGGRTELQFNLEVDDRFDPSEIRHGVAFSLHRDISVPDVSVFYPKIRRFNDFVTLYQSDLADMRMWHYADEPSHDYMPSPIPPDLAQANTFIFLGKRTPWSEVDVERILSDFDRLLPLYKYVEAPDITELDAPPMNPDETALRFEPGHAPRKKRTTASASEETIDVHLRHGRLQDRLVTELEQEHGKGAVGSEVKNLDRMIDVVVQKDSGYDFYEIKRYPSARACLREALGQLLEFSYWPGAETGDRLIVAGPAPLGPRAKAYLTRLRDDFGLPIDYHQVDA